MRAIVAHAAMSNDHFSGAPPGATFTPREGLGRWAHDRNMLFGILALQMDFITRDALVAAMNAWVLEKSKPLGAILVEQGRLPSDTGANPRRLGAKARELVRQRPAAKSRIR